MALPTFIPPLAFLLILFPLAMLSVLPPPAPDISVSPLKPRFLIGDTVSITCSVPEGAGPYRMFGFRFSHESRITDAATYKPSFARIFNVTGPQDGGNYSCVYRVRGRDGGVTGSARSRDVVINVQDRPPRPNLTVAPSALTVEGQPLLFLCSAPSGAAERRFRFFQDELELPGGVAESSGSAGARLRVERSERNGTGNFSCRYEERTEGRWIASYASDAVGVEVEAPCPAPVLWVEPPSGVVAAGRRIRLGCAAPPRRFRHRFRFYRDGDVIDGDDVIGDVIGNASELLIPRVSQNFSGNFSCRVLEEVGGAWVEAPPSGGVAVVVRAPPPQPLLLLSAPSSSSHGSESIVSLTCLVPSGHSGHVRRRFRFYRDGAELRAAPWPQVWVVTSTAGRFSCGYEEELDTGWTASPPSEGVAVPVQLNLLPLVIGGVVGVASLILALLLAAWLCRRRRGGSRWRGLSPGDDTGTLPMGELEVAN